MIPGATALLTAAVLVLAAPAGAAVHTQNDNVTIADNTTATPFPSQLGVAAESGPITDVDVTLEWTHTRPQDIDMLLVSPDGTGVVLMSDACGVTGFEGSSTFDQSAAADVPAGDGCGATMRPKDHDPSETWTFPDAGTLDAFNGENPNGQWSLYVSDDQAGSTGSIEFWSLDIEVGSAEIHVPGAPYPAEIEVVADDSVITDLDVLLDGLMHGDAEDLDVFLEGPGGQRVWLLSDVCAGARWQNLDVDLDDEAPTAFPETVPEEPACNEPTRRPTAFDIESDGAFAAPAPPVPGAGDTSLSAFDLTDPDGLWRLWAVDDDADIQTGFIVDGWDLQMSTRPAADVGFAVAAQTVREGDTLVVDVVRGGASPLGRGSVVVATSSGTAQAGRDFVPVSQIVTFEPGETTKSIAVPIIADGGFEPEHDFSVVLFAPDGDAKIGTPAAVGVTIQADAQQPPPDPLPGTERKPPPSPFTARNVLRSAPSSRRCFRRGQRIQFRPKFPEGVAITRTEVFVNGRKIEDNVGAAAIAPINLRMTGRRMRVRLDVHSHDGREVTIRRTFRRCKTRRRR